MTDSHAVSRTAIPAWHSVHIYYYEPDKTGLMLDAIRPLLESLREITPDAHVLRHWRRGPHLRLNIRADDGTWTEAVRPAVDRIIGGYLAAHPSTARLDQGAALAQHKLLAALEDEPGPLTPWFPDNSIRYEPYDSRLHVLRDAEAAELLASFYTDATPPLFEMLEEVRAGRDTAELIGLGLMLANSITAMPPITGSFISYRSHAEGFIARTSSPRTIRRQFDSYYNQHKDQLTTRVRAVISTLEGTAEHPVPFVASWADLIATYRERATPLIAKGKLIRRPIFDPAKNEERPSEFHRMMFGNRAYHRAIFESARFSRYRLLINYTYLQIRRLGLTPPQRFRLCHLAANAVEDVYNINAIELIRHYTDTHPNEEISAPPGLC